MIIFVTTVFFLINRKYHGVLFPLLSEKGERRPSLSYKTILELEICDSQNLAKLGLVGKPSLLVL